METGMFQFLLQLRTLIKYRDGCDQRHGRFQAVFHMLQSQYIQIHLLVFLLNDYAPTGCPIWIIDPKANELSYPDSITPINEKAGAALPRLVQSLLKEEIIL